MSSDFEAEDGELPESPVHQNDNYDSINMEIESTGVKCLFLIY